MTKETINGRFEVTYKATDFVDDFTSLEEVNFADMRLAAGRFAQSYEKDHGKQNVKIELIPAEMMFKVSYDKN